VPGTGTWSYTGSLISNTCNFGPEPGETRSFNFSWQEQGTPDGKLVNGERVAITDLDFNFTDTRTFTYPNFQFSLIWERGGNQAYETHSVTFSPSGAVTVNSITENYDANGCAITWG